MCHVQMSIGWYSEETKRDISRLLSPLQKWRTTSYFLRFRRRPGLTEGPVPKGEASQLQHRRRQQARAGGIGYKTKCCEW